VGLVRVLLDYCPELELIEFVENVDQLLLENAQVPPHDLLVEIVVFSVRVDRRALDLVLTLAHWIGFGKLIRICY
jgi:hypothetical protein